MDQPNPAVKRPQRSLPAWLARYGLVGAVAAPLVAMSVSSHGWLSNDLFYLSPILGLLVGSVCGLAGWAVSKVIRS